MTQYIDAKLQIVRSENDIVTASFTAPHDQMGNGQQLTPGRKSIWD